MRMGICLNEEAEDLRCEHEDDIDSADDYLRDITRVPDEITPWWSYDDYRLRRHIHPDAVYWFDKALYDLRREPTFRKVTIASPP